MAKDHSFDIVFEINFQEINNAVEQSKKEIATRYDFKDSNSSIKWDLTDKKIEINTENEFRLRSIIDIIQTKFAKRGVSLRSWDPQEVEKALGGTVRQVIKILHGIAIDKAKEIVRYIKDSKIKAQAQIQSDQVRVQSAKIDNLQEVQQLVKGKNFGLDLQFINYR